MTLSKLTGKVEYKMIFSVFLILLIVLSAFLPSLNNKFTNFDDDAYVTANPIIRDLSFEGVKRMFTPATYLVFHPDPPQLYLPLVAFTYAIEYHFFGLNPLVYHVTNLFLHLLNCLLVFWLIFLLVRKIPVALIVSILFGIHPLHVESVAWITERKDVLYAFFFLGTLICYIYWQKYKFKALFAAQIILFAASLLSKASAVTLPFILLLYDYYANREINWKNLFNKIPYFIIIAAFLFLSQVMTAHSKIDPNFTIWDHFLVSCYSLLFYLGKLIAPIRLSCIYPYPLKTGNNLPLIFLISPLIILFLSSVVLFSLRFTRKIVFGAFFFFLAVLPYLQIFPFTGPAIVADRYAYIPSIGIFFIFAETFIYLMQRKTKHENVLRFILAVFLVAIIGVSFISTRNRCLVWENSLTLWSDAINKYPDGQIPVAYFDRGIIYMRAAEDTKAISDFNRALELYHKRLKSDYVYKNIPKGSSANAEYCLDVYNVLAVEFSQINMQKQAVIILKTIIKRKPDYANAYNNLVSVYGSAGMNKRAIVAAEKAVEIFPNSPLAHYNLSVAYYSDRQYDLAVKELDISLKLGFKPNPEFFGLLEKYRNEETAK